VVVLTAFFVFVWLVLYPDPRPFVSSISRLFEPPLDPQAVAGIAGTLPDDAAVVEAFSQDYLPYKTAWELYDMPWYFPTVAEVVEKRGGDCQAEALLTASILEAKSLPYTLHYSFNHVWVDYPGKNVTHMEDPALSFASNEGESWLAALPDRFPLRDIVVARIDYHWDPMPLIRKLLLAFGAVVALLASERPWRVRFVTETRNRWSTRRREQRSVHAPEAGPTS